MTSKIFTQERIRLFKPGLTTLIFLAISQALGFVSFDLPVGKARMMGGNEMRGFSQSEVPEVRDARILVRNATVRTIS